MYQTVHLSLKTFSLFCLSCLFASSAVAQLINGVQFDKLPQDYQLYPRDTRSEARVPISGRVSQPNGQYISATLFRNKQAVAYRRAAIQYTNGTGQFAIDPFTIRAERAEYDIRVYLVNGNDSVNTVNRSNIVAGDVYVLSGQSNAAAFFRETRTNEFCRTFGKITGSFNIEQYNPADTAWAVANAGGYAQNVGPMGFAFQQYILERFGIPTCLINGSMHWSKMEQHATRTPGNPADLTNGYGRMLYRLQKAGVAGAVKALIFRQGETEAIGEGPDWPGNFDRYYQHLKTDLPSIQQLYLFQIDIINPAFPIAPQVREAQRQKARQYPDIQGLASFGTKGFDGIHYTDEGYEQNGREVGRLIGRDVYGSPEPMGLDAPNLWRAYFSSANRDEITLLFAPDQVLVWNEQQGNRLLKNFIYLDGLPGRVKAGRAVDNRIVLTLEGGTSATKLSYLPSLYPESLPEYPYTGPYLTNHQGARALSFEQVPIADPGSVLAPTLATPAATAKPVSGSALTITVAGVAGATGYVLEAQTAPGVFTQMAISTEGSGGTVFANVSTKPGELYAFRVKAFNRVGESAYTLLEGRAVLPVAAPELTATATYANVVRLLWKAVPEATGYVLERRRANETTFTALASAGTAQLTLTDSLLTDGQRYTYRIKATGRFGDSPYTTAEVQTPAYLPAPTLVADATYNNVIQLSWPTVPGATSYRLERQTGTQPAELISTPGASVTTLTDANRQPGTMYTYRLKAFGDRTESPVVSVSVQTPALLATPTLSVSVIYANTLQVAWNRVPGTDQYQLTRKTATDANYQPVRTVSAAENSLIDSLLTPGTTYFYQIRAVAARTESMVGSAAATTPALLATPTPQATLLYNNAVQLTWTNVPNATQYRVGRRTASETTFRPMGTFVAPLALLRDTSLVPGTTYLYRVQAFGDKTESLVGSTSVTTPSLLATPELTVTTVSFDTLRLDWKAVPGASYYQLERRRKGDAVFGISTRLDPSFVQYVDTALRPITTYEYRLTAFADLTRSNPVTAEATTLVLLAAEDPRLSFSMAPNPARGQVMLRFAQPTSGTLYLIGLSGRTHHEQLLVQALDVPLPLTAVSSGTYLIRVVSPLGTLVKKLLVE